MPREINLTLLLDFIQKVKKILEQKLPKEEIENIENKEADQNAESNTRSVVTSVEVCRTLLLSQNTSLKEVYNTKDGCADYNFLVSSEYLKEIPDDPRPVIKVDSGNSIICVWAKGGSIGKNNWTLYATDNAKIILENGDSKKIDIGEISTFKLDSNPKSCNM